MYTVRTFEGTMCTVPSYEGMFFTRKTWFFAHYPIVVVYTALQYKSPIKLGFDREGLRPLSPELALMRQS
jgi:hypothetical protein